MALADLVGLPDVPVVVFDRPPLVLAICQVRYATELRVTDPTVVSRYQDAIRSELPVASQAQALGVHIPLGIGTAQIKQGTQWHFTDLEDVWKVVVAPNFLTLETRRYSSFGDFLGRLRRVLDAFRQEVAPAVVTRLGLRYINEIRPGHARWVEVVSPELLGPLAVPELSVAVNHSLQQIQLRYPDNQGINLNHGLIPAGNAVQPRAGEQLPPGSFYLLDFDTFRDFAVPLAFILDTSRICAEIEEFNKVVYRLFRWAIRSDYIQTLGVGGGDDKSGS
jgi:uncharacterized protein (TIGR04255 family)